ncbi:hypothetical protein MPH_10188 [Macrophomina phaseolina MS6]|uniref:Fungal N-terminal domain-containing protein n=1 Tax=Macrophomina phaseolina (strain MS6) TaxID=1126212 RepID=K2RR59_MACPH|nr:hypothetical protein MPH_10188 [Macrophomina phaseolina MS6]
MEPFGAAVSVLTIIELTHKAVFSLYESYRTIKAADDDRFHIIRELRDLQRVLDRTLDIISNQNLPTEAQRDHIGKLLAYLEDKEVRLSPARTRSSPFKKY